MPAPFFPQTINGIAAQPHRDLAVQCQQKRGALRPVNEVSENPLPLDSAGRRDAWRRRRVRMEGSGRKHTPLGHRKRRHWDRFKVLVWLFGTGLKVIGLYGRGVRNALDIRLNRLELTFPALPPAFDGFRILHVSDLHVDALPEIMETALRTITCVDHDLCVLTGDYKRGFTGPFHHVMPALGDLASRICPAYGIHAVLGNHDTADMAEAMEELGIRVLVNESHSIEKDGAEIHLTGTDDVHYFYTDDARAALAQAPRGFNIALVHSPELAHVAAENGFQLYLTGHTHGGQVCLPGSRPVVTHLVRHRAYASGLWRHHDMVGYTSTGLGVSALPVRFNSVGEIALIVLRRAATDEPAP